MAWRFRKRRNYPVTDSQLKPRSHALVDGANRAGARAMLRACGLKDDDFQKPLIGVANTWIEIGPCNYHLRELAEHVKARSEEHTSELQSRFDLVCRLL